MIAVIKNNYVQKLRNKHIKIFTTQLNLDYYQNVFIIYLLILGQNMSASFETVSVVDVHKDNIQTIWPSLMLALKSATYVAIDTVSLI